MNVFIMDIPGIPGECQLAGFEKKIELLSVSHGVMMQVRSERDRGGDRTDGRPNHQDFAVTKNLDPTSPLLNLACCTGKDLGTIKITLARKEQSAVTAFMVYELSHAIISAVSTSGGGDGMAMEVLTLNYTQIRWKFIPAQGAGNPVHSGWDLENNKVF